MRDRIKDSSYFTEYIEEKTQGEQRIEQRISEGQIREDRIGPMRAMLFMYRMPTMLAAYARGDNPHSLLPQLQSMMELAQDYWNAEMYEIMLQMVSMGILLDVDDSHFDILKRLIEKAAYNDWLLNFLLHFRYHEVSYEGLNNYIPKVYDELKAMTVDKEQAIEIMRQYLSKWYANHKDASWYDTHKDTSKHLYFGYFSLEAGAMVKILGLDDTKLRDNEHYPVDLVHN